MAVIVIDHTITIKKDCRPSPLPWDLVLGTDKRLGNTDIDKVFLERHPEQLVVTGKSRKDILFERAAGAEPVNQSSPKEVDTGADKPVSRMLRARAKSDDPVVMDLDYPIPGGVLQRSDGDSTGHRRLANYAA